MRIRFRPVTGEAVQWDGNPETLGKIRDLIGDELIGVFGEYLLLRRKQGRTAYIEQGFHIVAWDGMTPCSVHSDGNFTRLTEPAE